MASPLRDPRDYRFVDWARSNGSGFAIENKLAHGEAMVPIETIRNCDARSGKRVVLAAVITAACRDGDEASRRIDRCVKQAPALVHERADDEQRNADECQRGPDDHQYCDIPSDLARRPVHWAFLLGPPHRTRHILHIAHDTKIP
jgi:hypothetical protein